MYRIFANIIILGVLLLCIYGCGMLYSVNVIENNDGVKTVNIYTFGCKHKIPEIYVNKSDSSVWQYCPDKNEKNARLWAAGPTVDEKRYFDFEFKKYPQDIPESFRSSIKIGMQECGRSIKGTTLYCGELADTGYRFKLWKERSLNDGVRLICRKYRK